MGVIENHIADPVKYCLQYDFQLVLHCIDKLRKIDVICMKGVTYMANLNIRIDDTLKKQAENVCSELGISLSAAVTVFLKQVVRYNGIPFELRADPFYSAENQKHLLESKERMERTGGTVHATVETQD